MTYTNIHKITGWLFKISLGIILFIIPAIYDDFLKGSSENAKCLFFVGGILWLFVLKCSDLLFRKDLKFNVTAIDLILLVLYTYICINKIFAPGNQQSYQLLELNALAAFYLLIRCICWKQDYWLLFFIIGGAFWQCLSGLLQLYGYTSSNNNYFPITGGFDNPGPYAAYLISALPLALGFFLYKDNLFAVNRSGNYFASRLRISLISYLPLISCLLIIVVLPSTQSRSAWIAAGCSISVLCAKRYHLRHTIKNLISNAVYRRVLLGITFVIVVLLMLGLVFYKLPSSKGRLLIWKIDLRMISDKPVFGYGYDNFKSHYMDYQAAYFKTHHDKQEQLISDDNDYAFNDLLQFTIENGLAGGAILLTLLLYILFDKSDQPLMLIAKVCILSVFVFSQFSYALYLLPLKISLLVFVAIINAYQPVVKVLSITRWFNVWINRVTICVVCIAIEGWVGGYLAREYIFLQQWKSSSDLLQSGIYVSATEAYKSCYSNFKDNGEFLKEYGQALTLNANYDEAITILKEAAFYHDDSGVEVLLGKTYQQKGAFILAVNYYQRACDMVPSKFYPAYLLANLYLEMGNADKAKETALLILKKPVKVPSIAIDQIKQAMRKIIYEKNN
jgi:O-antigen polymerase